MAENRPEELVGRRVIVTHPELADTRWEGEVVALVSEPSILLRPTDGGGTVLLPPAWAEIVPDEEPAPEPADG